MEILQFPQKLSLLLKVLKKRRFPQLSSLEKQFEAIKKEMNLPPEITIAASPYFEDNKYRVHFTFTTEKDYNNTIKILQNALEKGNIKKIEEII